MNHFRTRLIFSLAALAVTVFGVRFVEAQFISPSQQPPSGGPTVIYSIPSTSPAQNASINVTGTIKTSGCDGATYAGLSSPDFGNPGSYVVSDGYCSSFGAGAHVCRIEEVLESIRCARPSLPTANAWINGGPPGYTADSNDCGGWTSSSDSFYGRVWQFNSSTGGSGTMTTCSAFLPFACCT